MTTTKTMPIAEEKLRIFLQYYGQKFYRTQYYSQPPATVHPGSREDILSIADLAAIDKDPHPNIGKIHDCLLLKPLDKISDPHCREVYKILHKHDYPATSRPDLDIIDIRDYIEAYLADEIRQDVVDQLREWGYALPYKNWSVKELEEFGIYKLID